ncbi:Uncharacterized protein Rs2_13613 [Raphanus sativus]|nr:Uncharacterized protein Rs2_13613 [Raphanus sativus]
MQQPHRCASHYLTISYLARNQGWGGAHLWWRRDFFGFGRLRTSKCDEELMWMDLLMVDVNSTVMQVTISPGRLPQFRDSLRAGAMFSVAGFEVSRCAQKKL